MWSEGGGAIGGVLYVAKTHRKKNHAIKKKYGDAPIKILTRDLFIVYALMRHEKARHIMAIISKLVSGSK